MCYIRVALVLPLVLCFKLDFVKILVGTLHFTILLAFANMYCCQNCYCLLPPCLLHLTYPTPFILFFFHSLRLLPRLNKYFKYQAAYLHPCYTSPALPALAISHGYPCQPCFASSPPLALLPHTSCQLAPCFSASSQLASLSPKVIYKLFLSRCHLPILHI